MTDIPFVEESCSFDYPRLLASSSDGGSDSSQTVRIGMFEPQFNHRMM